MSFAFFRDFGGRLRVTRGWLEWPHCVPPNPIWSDTSLFLSVSKSQSSQSPLSSELKPSSSSLESCPLRCPMDQRWELAKIIMRRKRRMLLWATWSSRVVLTSWSSFTLGDWPWCVSKLEQKKAYHPSSSGEAAALKLPGAYTQTASLSYRWLWETVWLEGVEKFKGFL